MTKFVVNVDGGARGNPGPAAAAAVVADVDGEIVDRRSEYLGKATNNVAEYRALLLGIKAAKELGASEVELVGDSELVVKQIRGEYRVKDSNLRELYTLAIRAFGDFDSWSIRHVKRADNAEADRLVNEELDGRARSDPDTRRDLDHGGAG